MNLGIGDISLKIYFVILNAACIKYNLLAKQALRTFYATSV